MRHFFASFPKSLIFDRMIIIMTMNVGLFFAVMIGYFIGELALGRVHYTTSRGC